MPLKFPSNKTLAKIAVYGAIASISGVMYMRSKMEERVRKTEYFQESFSLLRKNPGAIKLLGEPIKEKGFDLSNPAKNKWTGRDVKFEVDVAGPKDKGTLYFWATFVNDHWNLDRLELEVKSHPDKRFMLKLPPTQDTTS